MPLVGFEPTIPVFGRAKTVHALDRAATVIGLNLVHALRPLFYKIYFNIIPPSTAMSFKRSLPSGYQRYN
jgi:hypothetical protein